MPDSNELIIEVGDVKVSLTRKNHVGHLQIKGCKSIEELGAVLSEEQMRSLGEFLLGGEDISEIETGDVTAVPIADTRCDICGEWISELFKCENCDVEGCLTCISMRAEAVLCNECDDHKGSR